MTKLPVEEKASETDGATAKKTPKEWPEEKPTKTKEIAHVVDDDDDAKEELELESKVWVEIKKATTIIVWKIEKPVNKFSDNLTRGVQCPTLIDVNDEFTLQMTIQPLLGDGIGPSMKTQKPQIENDLRAGKLPAQINLKVRDMAPTSKKPLIGKFGRFVGDPDNKFGSSQ